MNSRHTDEIKIFSNVNSPCESTEIHRGTATLFQQLSYACAHSQSSSCIIYSSILFADTYIYSLLELWV